MNLKKIEDVIATKIPYYISDLGTVFKGELEDLEPVILTIHNNKYELKIQYENSVKVQILFVHRLVAKYFIENPGRFNNVIHKDGNKLNNCVGNLFWSHHNRDLSKSIVFNRDGTKTRLKKKGPPIELLKGEEWINHPKLHNIKVSNKGRVAHGNYLYFQKGNEETYRTVVIKGKSYTVHRLVLESFIECKSSDEYQVNHIDGVKSHNDLSNLEWVTKSQNAVDKNQRNKGKEKTPWIEIYIEKSKITQEELDKQKWKKIPVEGFEKFYVSNLGLVQKRFFDKNRYIEKYITPTLMTKSNYFEYRLTIGNRKHGRLPYQELRRGAHYLVALAWIDNPENKYSVNHKDCNTYNNRLDNLEWATIIEQNRHYKNIKNQ